MKYLSSLALSVLMLLTSLPASAADEWISLGKGRMTDFIFTAFSLPPTTFEVEIEKSATAPGVYRIAEPYANFVNPDPSRFVYDPSLATPMVIRPVTDTKFYFEQFNTGYTVDGLEVSGICEAQFLIEDFHSAVLDVMPDALGDFDGESFTYNTYYNYQGSPSSCLVMGWGWYDYACNIDGEFLITLPGAKDYTCRIGLTAPCTADNRFSLALDYTSSDVAEVRYAAIAGIHRVNDEIFAKTIAKATATDLSAIELDLSTEPDGMYSFFLATLDSDGKIRSRDAVYLDVYHNDPAAWKEIGTGKYTDDIVASAYQTLSATSHDVKVEESVSTPGLYRVVDPYGAAFSYSDLNRLNCSDHSHYMVIDATDPDRVFILPGAIGFENEYGAMHVSSVAWDHLAAGKSKSEIDVLNVWGKLDSTDNAITFPAEALQTTEFTDKGKWFPSNLHGTFRLVLPESASITDVITDGAEQGVIYYDLHGRRVAEPRPGQLLIRRSATETMKIVIR